MTRARGRHTGVVPSVVQVVRAVIAPVTRTRVFRTLAPRVMPVVERAQYLWRLLDQFVARQDEVIDAVIAETGKARSEAISMEVFACCDAIAYYAKRAPKFLAPERRGIHGVMGFAKKLTLVYKPLGVVGLITPWNGPVVLAVNPLVQAIVKAYEDNKPTRKKRGD